MGIFHDFLNCTNDTKLREASQMVLMTECDKFKTDNKHMNDATKIFIFATKRKSC